jgi:hypothetical protein
MIFGEDVGRKYEATNGRSGERKVRTHRAGSQRVRGATLVMSFVNTLSVACGLFPRRVFPESLALGP